MGRIVLNETSYHGAGCIAEIATEVKGRAFKKAFVCSDPDLIKFGVTAKVTKVLDDAGLAYEIYSNIKPNPTILQRFMLLFSLIFVLAIIMQQMIKLANNIPNTIALSAKYVFDTMLACFEYLTPLSKANIFASRYCSRGYNQLRYHRC